MADEYRVMPRGVERTSDHAFIPNAPGNRDWQAYQAWRSANPAPAPANSAPAVTPTGPTGANFDALRQWNANKSIPRPPAAPAVQPQNQAPDWLGQMFSDYDKQRQRQFLSRGKSGGIPAFAPFGARLGDFANYYYSHAPASAQSKSQSPLVGPSPKP